MIKYKFNCINSHNFDIWFKSSDFCDEQMQKKELFCPICNSKDVYKQLVAPAIIRSTSKSKNSNDETDVEILGKQLQNLQNYIKNNFMYVGKEFKDTAIKMHKEEINKQNIYGEASINDLEELIDEGVEFLPLPVLQKNNKKLN